LSLLQVVRGRPISAAWLGLIPTVTDRLDGLLARALDAQSEFGRHMDSFADLVCFGVLPAAVCYGFFAARPGLGWSGPLLAALAVLYVLGAAVRLARFNVQAKGGAPGYTGVPSTMTAGILLVTFLVGAKYADPAFTAPEVADGWRRLGPGSDLLLRGFPVLLLVGVVGMVSTLRVPRLGRTPHLVTDVILCAVLVVGIGLGLWRHLPEYLLLGGLYYFVRSLVYHVRHPPS
jgi:phosphatidylserine synthase